MGVQSPRIMRIPQPTRTEESAVVVMGGWHHKVELARAISTDPTTRRRRSKPVPGQPPANVENRRRKQTPFCSLLASNFSRGIETLERVGILTL